LQKEVRPPDKAVRRAMCQLKRDLDFVGGLHSGWQRLEKEDQILGRLVLLLFCIRNITFLKVRVERTEFEFLFPLSAARENTPSTSECQASLKLDPPKSHTFSPEETRYVYAGYIHVCIHLNYPITVYEYVHLLRTQRLLLLILALFPICFLLTGRA
jgi:hypothetical protein